MKKNETLDAMEFIDSDIIDEADRYKPIKKSKNWIKWGSMVASMCIIVGTIVMVQFEKTNTMTDTMTGDEMQSVNTANAEEDNVQDIEDLQAALMIDQFDKSLNDNDDIAVNNGCFELSNSLKAAIEKYGDSVSYRVVVEVFKDGTVINSGSCEVASEEIRLANENYIVAHEKYGDTVEVYDYSTIHAKMEQLLNFSVSDRYGYYISFYSEYAGLYQSKDETNIEFITPVNQSNTDQPVDESNPGYMQATEYPEDIVKMQERISVGMTAGELSFIYKSAIYENPLRIEVSVGDVDEKQIDDFIAEYDPTGAYIVIKQGGQAIKEMKDF